MTIANDYAIAAAEDDAGAGAGDDVNVYTFNCYDPVDAPPTEETPLHKAIYEMVVTPENLEKITEKYEDMTAEELANSLILPADITGLMRIMCLVENTINKAHPASGNTPLHTAVFACFREDQDFGSEFQIYNLCSQLINYGADLNAQNDAGMTPVELADELITFLEVEDDVNYNPYLKYREHVKLKRRLSHLYIIRSLLHII